jgi:hypothetical protein
LQEGISNEKGSKGVEVEQEQQPKEQKKELQVPKYRKYSQVIKGMIVPKTRKRYFRHQREGRTR